MTYLTGIRKLQDALRYIRASFDFDNCTAEELAALDDSESLLKDMLRTMRADNRNGR